MISGHALRAVCNNRIEGTAGECRELELLVADGFRGRAHIRLGHGTQDGSVGYPQLAGG